MITARAAFLLVASCMALSGLAAQELSASLDSARIEMGSTTYLRLSFTAPTHQPAPHSSPDELRAVPELEILEQTPFRKTAGGWEQSFQIIAFQAGEYEVPVPVVNWNDSLYRIEPLRWVVLPPASPADGTPAPIKDIIEEPKKFGDYLLPVSIAAAVLLLGFLARHVWRRRKQAFELPSEPELPPHEQARKLLEELQQSRLWISDHKQFYILLSDALRLYLSRRYHSSSLTETTDQILQNMRTWCADESVLDALREILQTSDLVKFAKAVPGESTSARLLEAAFQVVAKTTAT